MDLKEVEHIHFNALGGADNIIVGDLTGTGVTQVAIDLAGSVGGTAGDGQSDTVTVNGSAGADHINVTASGTTVIVGGLPAQVILTHVEATDMLLVLGGAGDDTIDASSVLANHVGLSLNGGAGADVIRGSHGDDLVSGGTGNDVAFMGDGSDVVEGQVGSDTLQFNGANIAETITISANGARASFSRDVAAITMDTNSVETINFKALGGADNIKVNDLSGTSVGQVNLDLGVLGGGGDGAVDTITINATSGDDVISVVNNNGVVTVSGLAATVTIAGFEASDRLVINGLDGDDVIEASGLGAAMLLTANGGNGDDILIGGTGNDELHGDAGDDVLIGNGGNDTLDGGPGGNVIIAAATVPSLSLAGHHVSDFHFG